MSIKDRFASLRDGIEARVEDALPVDDTATPKTDTGAMARLGRRALWLGLALFLAWAAFAPLSEGVPVHGFIKVEGNVKTVQHLRGGIVEEINVREGDRVEAGQQLMRLNETQLKSQLGVIEAQLISTLAVEARLTSERDNRAGVVYPEFLLSRRKEPEVRDVMSAQDQLFATRRAAVEGERKIGMETITALQEQIQGYSAQEKARGDQLQLFAEELTALKPLYEQGFVPRTRMFELERAVSQLSGQRSEDLSNIGKAKSQIAETRLRILQSVENYRKETQTQLTDAQKQAADARERHIGTLDDLERVVLRAPVAGAVVGVTVFTVGGVIQPGQRLMDIVPKGQELVVEAQIPTHLIDSVRTGLVADVRFTALDRTLAPVVEGTLIYVSADRVSEPNRPDITYYIGRISIGPEAMTKLKGHELQPGMPAEAVIKTRERSLLGYLVKPLSNRMHSAFTER
jgi:HlyD family type I secretion membrane fusion protein